MFENISFIWKKTMYAYLLLKYQASAYIWKEPKNFTVFEIS